MNVVYDPESDSMLITLRDQETEERDEVRPEVIADFGTDGRIVRFEIPRASEVVENAREVHFAVRE